MVTRHEERCNEKHIFSLIFLFAKDHRTMTSGWHGAPYVRRYGRELVSKPTISLKKKKSWGGYRRTTPHKISAAGELGGKVRRTSGPRSCSESSSMVHSRASWLFTKELHSSSPSHTHVRKSTVLAGGGRSVVVSVPRNRPSSFDVGAQYNSSRASNIIICGGPDRCCRV